MTTAPTTPEEGLTSVEATRRLTQWGPNRLPQSQRVTPMQRFIAQFNSPVVYILLAALGIDLGLWLVLQPGDLPAESLAIIVILLANAGLGVWQEQKSEAALARLQALAAAKSWVMRDGLLQQVKAETLVPGDLIRIEAGERIPADGVVTRKASLSVDESMLTGESFPIDKVVNDDVSSGTLATRGHAWVTVTATGPRSNMGKLAALIDSVQRERTPLDRRLERFGRQIAVIVLFIAALVIVMGLLTQGVNHLSQLLLFGVALAVAAVPESLPAVLTLAMALGMERMAGQNAIVRKLTAVEALGSVTVIVTDKTGTLTENAMRVARVESSDAHRNAILRAMVLANNANLDGAVGDPLELGLLDYALNHNIDLDTHLIDGWTRISEKAFSSEWKYMSVTVEKDADVLTIVKGAPEAVLTRCRLTPAEQNQWQQQLDQLAREGFRLLGFAEAPGHTADALCWLGVALFNDPPRAEVPAAITTAQQAGIRVIMVTGDHPATALSIAQAIGINSQQAITGEQLTDATAIDTYLRREQVFARVQPEHKMAIVRALQTQGEVVAVTGDGINDAPALKAADVGVAMGQRGSDVSREVADIILVDDNFATIIAAIQEGRSIYENIQKFIRTLFATNLIEVLLLVCASVIAFSSTHAGVELLLPLTALQILWVNLLTDSLPALAITTDQNPHTLTLAPHAKNAPLLDQASLIFILITGGSGGLSALVLYFTTNLTAPDHLSTQSLVFCFLVLVQLLYIFPARKVNLPAHFNHWVILAIASALSLQVLAFSLPALRDLLGLRTLSWEQGAILGFVLLGNWLLAEKVASALRRRASLKAGQSCQCTAELLCAATRLPSSNFKYKRH